MLGRFRSAQGLVPSVPSPGPEHPLPLGGAKQSRGGTAGSGVWGGLQLLVPPHPAGQIRTWHVGPGPAAIPHTPRPCAWGPHGSVPGSLRHFPWGLGGCRRASDQSSSLTGKEGDVTGCCGVQGSDRGGDQRSWGAAVPAAVVTPPLRTGSPCVTALCFLGPYSGGSPWTGSVLWPQVTGRGGGRGAS